MGPAELAVFLHFQPILHGPFVFRRRIIPLFTVRTGQGNNISHDKPPYINGAHDQDRTGDLILTKDVLYRLSYVGRLPLKSAAFSSQRPSASRPIKTFCQTPARLRETVPLTVKQNGAGNGIRTRDPQLGRLTL
jgi:hypothetical protein